MVSQNSLLNYIRELGRRVGRRQAAGPSDAELLTRYLEHKDQGAFELLVWRHGGLVLAICRRVLRHEQDAEDAFQATFLVLARKAASVGKRGSVGSWLYKVAYRCALAARATAVRRARREGQGVGREPAVAAAEPGHAEALAAIDGEVARLPERYRLPFVLCDVEGHTLGEAAARLGRPLETVATQVRRARERLRQRLTRRGVTMAVGAAVVVSLDREAAAAVPIRLIGPTVNAVNLAGAVPGRVSGLAKGVLRAMCVKKALAPAAIALACVVAGGVAAYRGVVATEKATGVAPSADAPPKAKATETDPRLIAVLESALQDAGTIEDPMQRVNAYCLIARVQARAGRGEAAAASLRKALKAESKVLRQVLADHKDNRLSLIAACQAETGDGKGALETVTEGVSEPNQNAALYEVAAGLARAGDVKEALKLADRIRGEGAGAWKDQALRQIAEGQARTGDPKGALKTAAGITAGTPAHASALAAAAVALANAGDRDGAAKWLAEVRAYARDDNKTAVLITLAEAKAALGLASEAGKTAAEVEAGGGRDRAWQVVAAALAARGDAKGAHGAAENIKDAHAKGEALKEVVGALLRSKDFAVATKVAAAIDDEMSRCYALMEVARSQAAAGRKDQAKQTLQDALVLGDRLQNPQGMLHVREYALAHLAGARAASGDLDGALEAAQKQDDAWVRAMARVRVAEALVEQARK